MAGESSLFKFLSPGRRFQSTDIQAAAGWGVAAATTALWVIQVFTFSKSVDLYILLFLISTYLYSESFDFLYWFKGCIDLLEN